MRAEQKAADPQEPIQRVAALKKRLFLEVGPARSNSITTVQYMLTLAKQPVGATRHAAVDLMRAAAEQSWGLAMLFQGRQCAIYNRNDNVVLFFPISIIGVLRTECPFFVYLQHRESEFDKEGKDWKFGLILAVHAALNKEGVESGVNLGTHAEAS